MKLLTGLLAAVLFSAATHAAGDDAPIEGKVFYRYINEQGAKVMHHSLPPEAAKRGYEIVSLAGIVLKVVPPALTPEQAAAAAAEKEQKRELEEWDASLLRRYSSVDEIESAKQRKLADLEANMAILISNLNTIQSQIRAEYAKGAGFERRGHAVPEMVLTNLQNLEAELEDTREKYIQREWEYEDVAEKFEQDKERFSQIHVKR
ncbi:hypothetical protein L1F30_00295 [Simiduia sp. 21SJ11W-1]|uniref:hypothetical protein n=1 Tax=Simiduia sp. 21SJ11W-1 TaxID=2909669 RepID=UPI0020A158C2|nr:hypothetical protein [Simiduia sp. 21SJ11W-1]UTA47993.1 hypothetical protein L1F30_00295 [Simiduia sp. 21SJ11W-1]